MEPSSPLAKNKPLTFTLKGVDSQHPTLSEAGISDTYAKQYGVGYFTGKGSMHGRIVFPFHDEEGRVLSYAGYSLKDGSWKYPPPDKFNPSLTLYGLCYALEAASTQDCTAHVLLCREPLAALRFKSEYPDSVPLAVTTSEFSAIQQDLLENVIEPGGKILFIAPREDPHIPDMLDVLFTRGYYVGLIRY